MCISLKTVFILQLTLSLIFVLYYILSELLKSSDENLLAMYYFFKIHSIVSFFIIYLWLLFSFVKNSILDYRNTKSFKANFLFTRKKSLEFINEDILILTNITRCLCFTWCVCFVIIFVFLSLLNDNYYNSMINKLMFLSKKFKQTWFVAQLTNVEYPFWKKILNFISSYVLFLILTKWTSLLIIITVFIGVLMYFYFFKPSNMLVFIYLISKIKSLFIFFNANKIETLVSILMLISVILLVIFYCF